MEPYLDLVLKEGLSKLVAFKMRLDGQEVGCLKKDPDGGSTK